MTTTVHDRIAQDVAQNDVLLFMKGTPVMPQCGFSAAVVHILSELGVKFKAVNVLAGRRNPPGHQGILELADHPAALREGRVRRRLRHHQRDVRAGRTGRVPQGTRDHAEERLKTSRGARDRAPLETDGFQQLPRVELDHEARLHLHGVGHIAQLGRAQELRRHLAVVGLDIVRALRARCSSPLRAPAPCPSPWCAVPACRLPSPDTKEW